MIFIWERLQLAILICLGIFVTISIYIHVEVFDFDLQKSKASFSPEQKILIMKLLILKFENFNVKLRNF